MIRIIVFWGLLGPPSFGNYHAKRPRSPHVKLKLVHMLLLRGQQRRKLTSGELQRGAREGENTSWCSGGNGCI